MASSSLCPQRLHPPLCVHPLLKSSPIPAGRPPSTSSLPPEAPALLQQLSAWEGRVSVAMDGITRLQAAATKQALSRSSARDER